MTEPTTAAGRDTGDEVRAASVPDTPEGRQLLHDYYADDDARKHIGLSFGQRLRQVEAEARQQDASALRAALRAAVGSGSIWYGGQFGHRPRSAGPP